MTNKLQFGRVSTAHLCRNLFYLGCLPILRPAFALAVKAALYFPFDRNIQTADGWFTSRPEPNFLLGLVVGVVCFCLAAALWWHICGVLFHFVEYLRSNTKPAPIPSPDSQDQ